MASSHHNHVADLDDVEFGIVAPDGREAMLQHCRDFAARGVPFIFDPGQAIPLFSGDEFRSMIGLATYVIVNDYESQLLQQRTGWSAAEIASRTRAYIVTLGPRGSLIHTEGRAPDPGRARAAWSTPPAAAMPTAPGSSSA